MQEDRRGSYEAVLELLKEFKIEVRADMKLIKDELKIIDDKIHETVHETICDNNKLYFNGFDPHKHVQDHHQVDDIAVQSKENRKAIRSTFEKWIDRAAWACITFIAMSTWTTITDNINKSKLPDKVQIEQKVDKNGPPPHNH